MACPGQSGEGRPAEAIETVSVRREGRLPDYHLGEQPATGRVHVDGEADATALLPDPWFHPCIFVCSKCSRLGGLGGERSGLAAGRGSTTFPPGARQGFRLY